MTLVIAHRGASAYAPENTIAAFALAYRQGADMIELDVQPTADGVLAIFHDHTTARWDGHPRPVSRCTLADLQALDIGGERVTTLEETLAFARETGMALNVELKTAGVGARCAALLRQYDMVERTVVSSFMPVALRELAVADPAVRRGYLMGTESYRPDIRARELWPFFALSAVGAAAWHPSRELPAVTRIIPLVRRAGYAVNVWTVDDPAQMRRLVAAGATGIITNKPDVAREALAKV
ncbi:MAG: glycerophosphodiester phosphodiesterase family protein [Chloroflexales bacterium]